MRSRRWHRNGRLVGDDVERCGHQGCSNPLFYLIGR
jgi:hypothetical protein